MREHKATVEKKNSFGQEKPPTESGSGGSHVPHLDGLRGDSRQEQQEEMAEFLFIQALPYALHPELNDTPFSTHFTFSDHFKYINTALCNESNYNLKCTQNYVVKCAGC